MLTERILLIETSHGLLAVNLPEAFARLCDGSLVDFDGLAAHQRYGWYLSLCQIAAMALARGGEAAAAEDDAAWCGLSDPEFWRQRLVALAPGCADTAWSLVVDDLTSPAFLQPPIGPGTLAGYTVAGRTPDEIDVLVTSKGHDVKAARAGAAEPRHWLFALCTLQTQQGYSGRGNFGIARMNGGFASRPMVMLTPTRDLPTRFRRGVQAALHARTDTLRYGGHDREGGMPLLWLRDWDAETSLHLVDLDPLFVEICRRIRLVRDGAGRLAAWSRPSEVTRVMAPKELKGNLGDAWTPVNQDEGSALTVGAAGFDYKLVNRLIATPDFKLPAAMIPHDDDRGALWLHAAVLVRGQGKTEGFHERWLLLPAQARRALLRSATAAPIERLSKSMVADAEGARKALSLGLLTFLQGGHDKVNFKDRRPDVWLTTFEHQVDGMFFKHLFARAEDPGDEVTAEAWRRALGGVARRLFQDATTQLDPPECRRERAAAVAFLTFGRMLRTAGLAAPREPAAALETES